MENRDEEEILLSEVMENENIELENKPESSQSEIRFEVNSPDKLPPVFAQQKSLVQPSDEIFDRNQYSIKQSELTEAVTDEEDFEVDDDQKDYSATSFHQAARDGNVQIIEDKIQHEFLGKRKKRIKALNQLDRDKLSPLHYAAKYGHLETARLLVEQGADVLLKGDDGCLPIHLAVKYRPDVFASSELFASPDDEDGKTVNRQESLDILKQRVRVMSTATDGFIETLKYLIERGIERDPAVISQDDSYGDAPLHYAVYRNNVEAAKILLERGADINDMDNSRRTPLHLAATNGSSAILSLFISHSASLHLADSDGTTALQLAVAEGHMEFAEMFLSAIGDQEGNYDGFTGLEGIKMALKHKDNENGNVLHYAVESGDSALARYILKQSRDSDCKELINLHKSDGDTPLHIASEKGFTDIVKILCRYGAKIEAFNRNHETAIYVAAKNSHEKVVAFLANRNKTAVNFRDSDGWSPLLIAASFGHKEVSEILLKNGAELTTKDKNDQNIAFIAALEGHDQYLEYILSTCENPFHLVNERDIYHSTPLHIAAHSGMSNCVKVLLKYKANPNLKNDVEQTAMHRAAEAGKKHVISVLAAKDNGLISDWDEDNNTPLHIAAKFGKFKCVRMLIGLGAQVDTTNTKGWTPLDCAAEAGALDVCIELLDNDAPLDPMDKSQVTPLHLACKNGHLEVVKCLLARGASLVAVDVEGRCAIDYAIDYFHEDVVEEILKSEFWKEALSNAIPTGKIEYPFITPMRKLIQSMPDQALVVLNKCMDISPMQFGKPTFFRPLSEVSRKTLESEKLKIRFNYDFVDDEFIILNQEWNKTKTEQSIDLTSMSDASFTSEGQGLPYVTNKSALLRNHPLNYLIEYKRQNLLTHPLIISLYKSKWNSVGKWVYYINLTVFSVLVALLNTYAFTIPPPYSVANYTSNNFTIDCSAGCIPIVDEKSARELYGDCYSPPSYRYAMSIIVIILAGLRLIIEFFEFLSRSFVDYFFDFTNIIEIFFYVLTIIFVLDFNPAFCDIKLDWQWQCGAVSIWLSWMVLLLFMQKVPVFGIYILMFITVFRTFCRFVTVFALFIIGFSFSLYMLFQNQVPFDSLPKTIVKSIVMMIGEYEYEGMFGAFIEDYCGDLDPNTNECTEWNEINFFNDVAYVMFIAFMVVMTIIISNMLIGLAVDDIKGVQDNAVLRRQALKIQLALESEYKIPNGMRYSWFHEKRRTDIEIGGTDFSIGVWIENFFAWIDPESEITTKKLKELQQEDQNDLEEVWEGIDELKVSMTRSQKQIRSVDSKVSRIDRMLVKLLRQSNIEISDDSDAD